MTIRTNISKRQLPKPAEDFVSSVCEKRKLYNAPFLPPLLVPIDSGNGRSTITKTIAGMFKETKSIRFSSSTHHYLECNPSGTSDAIYRMDMEIQDKTTKTNEFQGIIGIAADSLMTHLNDTVGEKFFDLCDRIKEKAMLIVFVPANANPKQVEIIANKLGIGTKVFDAITYDDQYLSRMFYNVSSAYSSAGTKYEDCQERIASYIETNIREKTLKNIKKAAQALLYDDQALIAIYNISRKTWKGRVI